MRYTVFLEPTNEADKPGWYYAHIPALDLTTHGLGLEGAMEAARDLVTGWIAELRSSGKEIPVEKQGFVSHIEIPDDAIQETLYLCSVPGMRESILKGLRTSTSKCSGELDW